MFFKKCYFTYFIHTLLVFCVDGDKNVKYEITELVDEGAGTVNNKNSGSHGYEVYEKVDENDGNSDVTNNNKNPVESNSIGSTNGYQVYEVVDEKTETPTNNNKYNSIKWMILPNSRGDVDVAILSGIEPRYDVPVEEIDFYLYTRQNPDRAEKLSMNSSCLPIFKYFKARRGTKVLIHGFGDSVQESIMYPLLRDAFMNRGDYNIFMIDWNKLAAAPWYGYASANTRKVGKHSAALLDHLSQSTGMEMSSVHLIGFSLGAHVAGIIGQNVKRGKIKRITALDPAQVLYSTINKEQRLDPDDAELVEVVHTSGGYLGFQDPLGHRDIFPNGGFWPQPGCQIDYAGVCSHRRAYYYYGEAVKSKKGFMAIPCNSWPEFMAGACKNYTNAFELANDNKSKKAKGNFFLKTNTESPFGIIENAMKESNLNEYDYFNFLG